VSEVPESGGFNWKDFCLAGLEAMHEPLVKRKLYLGAPHPGGTADAAAVSTTRTPANVMRRALIGALLHRAPGAFLIDEAQQLAMVTGSRKFQHQMDYVKRLADATRYDATRAQDAADFQDIVLSFQQHLPLAEPPDLSSHWEYLYLRSVGCIGLLKKWLLDALDQAVGAGAATITRADLERTAPPPSKGKKVLEEALDGEAALAELGPDADPRAAEAELRALLRLPLGSPVASSTPQTVLPSPAATARQRRPGQRQPARDPVAPADVAALTG